MKGHTVYQKLATEMAKRNIKRKTVAQSIGINDKSLYNKLRGDTLFTWDEVCGIRKIFFPDMALEELFTKAK